MKKTTLKAQLNSKLVVTPPIDMKTTFQKKRQQFFACPRCKQKAITLAFGAVLMLVMVIMRTPNQSVSTQDFNYFISEQLKLNKSLDLELTEQAISQVEIDEEIENNSLL